MNMPKRKYPRTYHFPYSETVTEDDKRLDSDSHFYQFDEVIVTEKMDGENTTCYPDGTMHARSIDSKSHPSRNWLKKYMQNWYFNMPTEYAICGENLYAKHSIAYTFHDEKQFFQTFGIVQILSERFESWDTVELWCELLEINHVPVIYRGKYDKDTILNVFADYKKTSKNEVEGFVVRNSSEFNVKDFSKNIAKYVRKNHVQTDKHWKETWVPNIIDSNF